VPLADLQAAAEAAAAARNAAALTAQAFGTVAAIYAAALDAASDAPLATCADVVRRHYPEPPPLT
jgi:hypothetical protein